MRVGLFPWLSVWLGIACLLPRAVHAADAPWLVIAVELDGGSRDSRAVRETEQALAARGLSVIAAPHAAQIFEQKHSKPPSDLSESVLRQLDAMQRGLDSAIGTEDTDGIRESCAALDAVPAELRDQRNHDVIRARRAFRSCVAAALVFDRKGDAAAMQEQLSSCTRDFPGVIPELPTSNDPAAAEFVARARELVGGAGSSQLRIEGEGMRKGTRCFARVNGIDRGGTPVSVAQLRAPEVRVQLECGKQNGRVYTVALTESDQQLTVDASLDAAVRSDGNLRLAYVDASAADGSRVRHAVALANVVRAQHVLELYQGKLRRIDVASGREVASDAIGGGVARAVDFVLANGPRVISAGETSAARAGITPARAGTARQSAGSYHGSAHAAATRTDIGTDSPSERRSGPPSRAFRTLGYVGIAVTIGAAAVAVVAWRAHERHIDRFNDRAECTDLDPSELDASCKRELDSADSAKTLMIAGAVAGGATLVLSGVFFLIDANRPRESERFACAPGVGDMGLACALRF